MSHVEDPRLSERRFDPRMGVVPTLRSSENRLRACSTVFHVEHSTGRVGVTRPNLRSLGAEAEAQSDSVPRGTLRGRPERPSPEPPWEPDQSACSTDAPRGTIGPGAIVPRHLERVGAIEAGALGLAQRFGNKGFGFRSLRRRRGLLLADQEVAAEGVGDGNGFAPVPLAAELADLIEVAAPDPENNLFGCNRLRGGPSEEGFEVAYGAGASKVERRNLLAKLFVAADKDLGFRKFNISKDFREESGLFHV